MQKLGCLSFSDLIDETRSILPAWQAGVPHERREDGGAGRGINEEFKD